MIATERGRVAAIAAYNVVFPDAASPITHTCKGDKLLEGSSRWARAARAALCAGERPEHRERVAAVRGWG